jgi:hypothetical protein
LVIKPKRNVPLIIDSEGVAKLKREHMLFIVALVVAGILIGVLLLPPAPNPDPDPEQVEFQGEWVISVGDTYQFDLQSWGEYNYGDYSNLEIDELISLYGTVINITITYLPTLDFIINKTTFENEIVDVRKVSCIFSNGTELPTTWSDVISETISGCIIPVGNWSILDAFHPTWDQVYDELYLRNYDYFSELFDESFQFGLFIPEDEGGGHEVWVGSISLDIGFPSTVSWSYDHMYGPIEFELTLRS